MRIIAGEFRSRRIQTPEDAEKTRPMPDRVREALFSILRGHVEGQTIVDAFAGTGAVGLEAISRGAERCIFIERDREIGALLQSNVQSLRAEDRCEVIVGDALGAAALARCPRPVHLVFFDPPYPLLLDDATRPRVYDQFARFASLLDDDGFAVLRTPFPFLAPFDPAQTLAERPRASDRGISLAIAGCVGPETHEYASTALNFYVKARPSAR